MPDSMSTATIHLPRPPAPGGTPSLRSMQESVPIGGDGLASPRDINHQQRGPPVSNKFCSLRRRAAARPNRALGVAVAAALALPSAAGAFEWDTGSEDLSIRFDNTVRLNVTSRANTQDTAIIANPNFDDGNRNFNEGHTFTRLDLLTEFDVVWKRALGFRVSAASWWDPGYSSLDNKSLQTSNNLDQATGLPVLGLDPHSKRYAEGPSAEFLDVFAFAKFNVGEARVNLKLGQTTVYWGEGLLLGGAIHGVSYSQNPIDVWKAYATPGAEAKELFRPRVGFNVQSQVTDTVSLAAQYFFNWQSFENQAYRYPEAGTYLSVGDPLLWGSESYIVSRNPFAASVPGAPTYLRAWRGEDILPDENTGNYGVAVRWSPQWADATIGAYYRRTYDMQGQLMLTPGFASVPSPAVCTGIGGQPLAATSPTPCIINKQATSVAALTTKGKFGEYNVAFGEDVDIFGLSLSKQVLGVSLGAELSYRQNMPLVSDAVQVLPKPLVNPKLGQIATTDVPESGTPGAIGDTMHGIVNLLGLIGDTPFWDVATYATELTWMTVVDVTQNEAVYKGRSNHSANWTPYQQIDRPDENFFGLAVNFTPTWFQVLPGVDLLAPLSYSEGISGNAAVSQGGNQGAGVWSVGIAADVRQRVRIDLKYVDLFGDYTRCPRKNAANPATCVNGAMDVNNGVAAVISDRDFIALTIKTTF